MDTEQKALSHWMSGSSGHRRLVRGTSLPQTQKEMGEGKEREGRETGAKEERRAEMT